MNREKYKRMLLKKFAGVYIIILPVALFFLFATSSCVNKKVDKNTVKFMCWGDVYNRMFNEKIVTEFKKQKQPSFDIKLLQIAPRYAYFQKLITLSAAGILPDVIIVVGREIKLLASKGTILPLREYLKSSDFIKNRDDYWPGVLAEGQWQGEQYGMPIWTWTRGIYYNKDLFDKFGVSYPEKGWTWDDFLEKARDLTETDNSQDKYYGFVRLGMGLQNAFVLEYLSSNIDNLYNEERTKCLIDTPEAIEALKWYFDILHRHEAVPTGADVESMEQESESGSGFVMGKVAMKPGGRTWADRLMKENADFRWDVIHMPVGKYDKGFQVSAFLAISANSKNPDKAWEFIKFCSGPEGQKIITADRSDISALKSITYTPEYINYLDRPELNIAFREMMEYAKPTPYIEGQNEWLQYTQGVFELMELKKISVEQGCHDIADAYKTMVSGRK